MNVETIFDNIDEYSHNIDDLVKALKQVGINNFEEFKNAARELSVPVKKSIQDQVAAKLSISDSDDWAEAQRQNTIEAYQNYLDNHQEGEYRSAARDMIDKLQNPAPAPVPQPTSAPISPSPLTVGIKALERQIKAIRTDARIFDPEQAIYDLIVDFINTDRISKSDLLTAIKEDNNFLSGTVANKLWKNRIIEDFSETGIDNDFIAHMMSNITLQKFEVPEPMTKITKSPCTEVYFWGIPSSGKSCALGAILSSANSGKVARCMQRDNDCQGYGYMNRLATLFKSNGAVGTLPEGTAVSSTYEMGFILEDEDGKEHPITCIDLAGELIRCMFKLDAGGSAALTDEEETVLKTLTNVLVDNRTDNRKIHFFVIEYGAEDREYEGLPQNIYLEAAVAYIQRTGIFKKDTDGLYLLITKVDKAKAVGEELQEKLRNYISDNYQGFYNGLKKICRDNEINKGIVEIQPFTLGTVCFQNYCKFKDDTAAAVVRTLLKRSYGYKPGKLKNIFDRLKK